MKRSRRVFIISLYFFAAVFITFVAVVSPAVKTVNSNGTTAKFNEGWEIINEDGSRAPFTAFGKKIDSNRIEIVHDISNLPPENRHLGFYNYYSAVEIYVDNILIYQLGSMEDLQNNVLLGNFYAMVDMYSDGSANNEIKLVFLNSNPQTIYGFYIGSGPALEIAAVQEYISTIFIPIVAIVFLIVSIFLWTRPRTKDLITQSHIWLVFFTLSISVWQLADSQLLIDLGLAAGKVCLISFEVYMLLPATLMLLMCYSCRKYRKLNVFMCDIVFANFIVLNILQFAGIKDFTQTLISTHICVGITMAIAMLQAVTEYQERPSKQSKYLLYGLIAFETSAVIQYMWFFDNPTMSNSHILQIGTFIFITLQIINVMGTVNYRIQQTGQQLEIRNKFLMKTFGSFIPDDIVQSIVDDPEDFGLGGETRRLTVLQSDIRGFSEILPKMSAADAINMLNHYMGAMTVIIQRHGGTLMEFAGDGILATFDSVTAGEHHANKAIFAAVEMQCCMEDIVQWNTKHGYPEFEMGIGLHTGDAYVGYIGSTARMKYDAIGSTINLAARIEGYSTGRQILISQACKDASTLKLEIEDSFSVMPKGTYEPVNLYLISGIGSPYNLSHTSHVDAPKQLSKPVQIQFQTIFNKFCGDKLYDGTIVAASETSATLQTDCPLMLFDNMRIGIDDKNISCKVISKSRNGFLIRFTSIPNNYSILTDAFKVDANE